MLTASSNRTQIATISITQETACTKRLYNQLQIHVLVAPLSDNLLLNRLGAVISLYNGVKSPSSFKLYAGSSSRSSTACKAAAAPAVEASVKEFSDQGVNKRLDFLVEQACDALDTSVANFKHVLFPCALIAGDVVILHLLHKQGLLQSGRGVRLRALEVATYMRSNIYCFSYTIRTAGDS